MSAPADISQKEEEHDRDENEPFREVMEDGVSRVVDEVAPIVEGNDLHARRQDVFRSALPPSSGRPRALRRNRRPLRMSTMPEDDIIVVDDLSIRAMNCPAELAEPDLGALRDRRRCP